MSDKLLDILMECENKKFDGLQKRKEEIDNIFKQCPTDGEKRALLRHVKEKYKELDESPSDKKFKDRRLEYEDALLKRFLKPTKEGSKFTIRILQEDLTDPRISRSYNTGYPNDHRNNRRNI